jgi:hypothetical protein
MTRKILIFDDEKDATEAWKVQLDTISVLKDDYEIVPVTDEKFRDAVKGLEGRRKQVREQSNFTLSYGDNLFDEAAILIIDYDLLQLYQDEFLTGEAVAYIARCYSKCGTIVALNQYGSNNFDLTLKGHPTSFADLNVGSMQISNAGLWTEQKVGFRPWSWPILPMAEVDLCNRVQTLTQNLDTPILQLLKFPDEVAQSLPRTVLEFLDVGKSSGKEAEEVTFKEFVINSRNGLRGKDANIASENPAFIEMFARIAAARVSKWLERLVLPGQDILVDAPHLASRYPSLLDGQHDDIEAWNRTTSFQVPAVKTHPIEDYAFSVNDWVSRPVWWWRQVSSDERIEEVSNPWATVRPDYVFCEDLSCFLHRNEVREFVADLTSPFIRRFAANPDVLEDPNLSSDLRNINYRPQVRFSL